MYYESVIFFVDYASGFFISSPVPVIVLDNIIFITHLKVCGVFILILQCTTLFMVFICNIHIVKCFYRLGFSIKIDLESDWTITVDIRYTYIDVLYKNTCK